MLTFLFIALIILSVCGVLTALVMFFDSECELWAEGLIVFVLSIFGILYSVVIGFARGADEEVKFFDDTIKTYNFAVNSKDQAYIYEKVNGGHHLAFYHEDGSHQIFFKDDYMILIDDSVEAPSAHKSYQCDLLILKLPMWEELKAKATLEMCGESRATTTIMMNSKHYNNGVLVEKGIEEAAQNNPLNIEVQDSLPKAQIFRGAGR